MSSLPATSPRPDADHGQLAALVSRVGAGDRAAEADLCRRFAPAVRSFARRRLRGAAIDEFVQDVMLLFVEALRESGVREGERVGGFVLGICRNLARDRARARERRDALWATYGSALSALTDEAPETLAYEAVHLEDCISQLQRRARDVVIHTFAEELSDAQIAARVGAGEGNVRVVRHRALKALRECMSRRMTWEAA